jgi:hypothetical protein
MEKKWLFFPFWLYLFNALSAQLKSFRGDTFHGLLIVAQGLLEFRE